MYVFGVVCVKWWRVMRLTPMWHCGRQHCPVCQL